MMEELWWSQKIEAKARAEEKARALLQLLSLRKLALTEEQKKQIESCTDLAQLDAWFARAFSAKKTNDIFASPQTKSSPKKTKK